MAPGPAFVRWWRGIDDDRCRLDHGTFCHPSFQPDRRFWVAFGLAANLIAVPMTALWVTPWAVAAFVLMPIGLELLALEPMGWGIEAIIAVAQTIADWPGAVSVIPLLPVAGLAIFALGALWLFLWNRPWRLFGQEWPWLGSPASCSSNHPTF
jgi:hypothetical protein